MLVDHLSSLATDLQTSDGFPDSFKLDKLEGLVAVSCMWVDRGASKRARSWVQRDAVKSCRLENRSPPALLMPPHRKL